MMSRRTILKLVALLPWGGAAIAKVLAKAPLSPRPAFAPYLPAEFPKWDRAIDGLSCPFQWTRNLERSRLPADMAVPRAGQVWEAVHDCEVAYRVMIDPVTPPSTSKRVLYEELLARAGGLAPLRRGERIRILGVDDPRKPLRVDFQPVRYQELQQAIVPEDVWMRAGYRGYELSLKSARTIADFAQEPGQTYFNRAFRLVEDTA
jgi:hypothetical protein